MDPVLKMDPVLSLAVQEMLDFWLGDAITAHLKRRGNKDNTREGDNPDIGEQATMFNNPEIDMFTKEPRRTTN